MNLRGAIDLSCRALLMMARHRTTMSAVSAWRRKNITKATGETDRAGYRPRLTGGRPQRLNPGIFRACQRRIFGPGAAAWQSDFRASVPACTREEKDHRDTYEFCRDGA